MTLFSGGMRTTENDRAGPPAAPQVALPRRVRLVRGRGVHPRARQPASRPTRSSTRRSRDRLDREPRRHAPDVGVSTRPRASSTCPSSQPVLQTLDQVVPVDYTIPGCPPEPDRIADVLDVLVAALTGRTAPAARQRPRCRRLDGVRRVRGATRDVKRIKRFARIQDARRGRSGRCACSSRACRATDRRRATGAARCAPPPGPRASAATGRATASIDYGARLMSAFASGDRRERAGGDRRASSTGCPDPGRPVLPLQPRRVAAAGAAAPTESACRRDGSTDMTRLTIDPITRLEGHGKIEIFLDDDGEVDGRLLPDPGAARLRDVLRRAAGRGDAEADQPHLRRLPRGAPHGRRQGRRRGVRRDPPPAGQAAPRAALQRVLRRPTTRPTSTRSAGPTSSSAPTRRRPSATSSACCAQGRRRGRRQGDRDAPRVATTSSRSIGGRRIHPCTSVPGGMTKRDQRGGARRDRGDRPLRRSSSRAVQPRAVRPDRPRRRRLLGTWSSATRTRHRTYYMGLVDAANKVELLRRHGSASSPRTADALGTYAPAEYRDWIAEHVEPWTYLKFPYLRKDRLEGLRRRHRLRRLLRDAAGPAQRRRRHGHAARPGRVRAVLRHARAGVGGRQALVHHRLATHWARLVELLYAAERMVELVARPGDHVDPTCAPCRPDADRGRRHRRGAARHAHPSLLDRRARAS